MTAATNGRRSGTRQGATTGQAPSAGAANRRIQRLADQAEIREGLERYFYAIDAGRYALFRKVFADDARADYAGGKLKLRGWRDIMEGMRTILGGMPNASSNHFITATEISVRGDSASSDTFGAIFVCQGRGAARTLTAMGVRYRDDWVRGRKGWRIRLRKHVRLWTSAGISADVVAKAVPRRR